MSRSASLQDGSRTTIVTGAAGGMGQAVTEMLVNEGWTVLAVDHNSQRLSTLEDRCTKLEGVMVPVLGNVESDEMLEDIKTVLDREGQLHGLVNMAGLSVGSDIESLEDVDWDHSFDVNVKAAMRLTRLSVPYLKATGGSSIVNVSSPVALAGARKPSYAASKAAMLGLTMSLARNLGKYGTRVNTLLPGTTITYMTQDWPQEKRDLIAAENFLGRLCRPGEIAAVIAFLLSDASSFMTGSIVDLTAGSLWGH